MSNNKTLTDVSPDLFYTVFQEVLKNPLQNLFLTHYTNEEMKEMDTKLIIVRNKKGNIKLCGMAIKNYKEEDENGNLVTIQNKEGTDFVKEPTGLFSVDLNSLPKELKDNVLNTLNSVVIEPDNYGENGEPNLILSLLQQEIMENIQGEIRSSHFGSFLGEQYKAMGYEITNEDGYDFNYEFLTPEAKKSYIKYIAIQISKMKKYKEFKPDFIKYNPDNNSITILGNELDKEETTYILNKINNSLRYFETILNKSSITFKVHGTKIKKIIKSSLIDFNGENTLKQFLNTIDNKNKEGFLSFQEIINMYSNNKNNNKNNKIIYT